MASHEDQFMFLIIIGPNSPALFRELSRLTRDMSDCCYIRSMQVSYDNKYHIQHLLLKVTGQRKYGADVSLSKKTKFLAGEWIVSS